MKLRVTQFKEQWSRRSVAHQRGDVEKSRRASYDESGKQEELSFIRPRSYGAVYNTRHLPWYHHPPSQIESRTNEPLTAKRKGERSHPAMLEDASGYGQGEVITGSGVCTPIPDLRFLLADSQFLITKRRNTQQQAAQHGSSQ